MTNPKRDEAMELAEKIHGPFEAYWSETGHKAHEEQLQKTAALIRPHLNPAPAVPEEVEKLATWYQHKHDDADGWAVTIHKADALQASTLLRSMAGEIEGLKAATLPIVRWAKAWEETHPHETALFEKHGEGRIFGCGTSKGIVELDLADLRKLAALLEQPK